MQDEITNTETGLVGKERLLELLFPNPIDRPTIRWLDKQCAKRVIPFIKIGRLIWFDVPQVRAAFCARAIVSPKRRSL